MPRNLRRFSPATPLLVLSLLMGLMSLPDANSHLLDLLRPTVRAATTFTVNSTGDGADNNLGDGACNDGTNGCTLRAAIQQANAAASADVINFNLPANSVITLNNTLDFINDDLNINGPGANTLTVQRSNASGTPRFRIFVILNQPITVNISGLTLSNGYTLDGVNGAAGGGILNSGATVNLADVAIEGNNTGNGIPGSGGFGGAVFNAGTMTISDSTISGNTPALEAVILAPSAAMAVGSSTWEC